MSKKYYYKNVDLNMKNKIEEVIIEELNSYKIDTHKSMLVFHELYSNAYYNNYHLPAVKLKLLKHSIIIRIDCVGGGFDHKKYTNNTPEERKATQLHESGRGIMIVEKIASRLIYNEKGNNVIVQLIEKDYEMEDTNEKS